MKIGIDFDSTIAKIDQPLLDRLNAIRGTHYQADEWSDWNLNFLPAKERRLLLSLLTPKLYQKVLPYPGAREAIRSLSKEPGIQLMCVTSNPEKNGKAFMKAKKQWLRRHIPELGDALVAATTKSGLGLDLLVDDAPHHHETADCVSVLVKRPWNRNVHSGLQFSDWKEGRRLLNRLIRKSHVENDERTKDVR
jgi:5'(3')-deoxyribonucleotidase